MKLNYAYIYSLDKQVDVLQSNNQALRKLNFYQSTVVLFNN